MTATMTGGRHDARHRLPDPVRIARTLREGRRPDHRRRRQALRLLELLRDREQEPSRTRRSCSARTRSTCWRRCAPRAPRPGTPARTTSSRSCMDGEVEIHLVKLDAEQTVPDAEQNGAVLVKGEPQGPEDGLAEAHGAATRRCCRRTPPTSSAPRSPAVLVLQTCKGDSQRRALGRHLPDRLTDRFEETRHERTRTNSPRSSRRQPDATLGYKTSRSAASASAATSTSPTSAGRRATAGR